MKTIRVSLEPELDEAVGRLAHAEGVSKAEFARRCIRERVEPLPPIEEDPFFAMFGTVKGGGPDDSVRHDEIIYGLKTYNG